jgi:putative endonuclease
MPRQYFVYILASRKHGTLYIGITNNIIRRAHEHKQKLVPGSSKKNEVDKLVHFEIFDDVTAAIAREKQLKRWRRDWKIELIESKNPNWVESLSHAGLRKRFVDPDCRPGRRAQRGRPGTHNQGPRMTRRSVVMGPGSRSGAARRSLGRYDNE